MNYFKFLYRRYKKRSIIRKLINDYEDLKESVIYAQINNVDFYEFLYTYIWYKPISSGICLLISTKYHKRIGFHHIWIGRYAKKEWHLHFAGYWCKPLAKCSKYDELIEAIQKRIDILYTELHNPKI